MRQPSTANYRTLERRTIAIERYEQQAERAERMGEAERVKGIHLTALSAAEIENLTWMLAQILDKLENATANT